MPAAPALNGHCYAITPQGTVGVRPAGGAQGMHGPLADLPNGVYSGLRTFEGGRFLALDAHVARAERSARTLGFALGADRGLLLRGLQQVADQAAPELLKLRFDILPEPAVLGGVRARLWIAAATYVPVPRRYLDEGVRVEVAADLVRQHPLVKTTDFVLRRRPYPLETGEAYEHLLVDSAGGILECTSSNFYAVCAGRLVTAGAGVLEGITRGLILDLVRAGGVPIDTRAPRLDGVDGWQEAFLSSSTRGLVPVVNVAGKRVGDGRPGPLTTAWRLAYDEMAERDARRAVE